MISRTQMTRVAFLFLIASCGVDVAVDDDATMDDDTTRDDDTAVDDDTTPYGATEVSFTLVAHGDTYSNGGCATGTSDECCSLLYVELLHS